MLCLEVYKKNVLKDWNEMKYDIFSLMCLRIYNRGNEKKKKKKDINNLTIKQFIYYLFYS